MISVENADTVKELHDKLCDRFQQFKAAHLLCLDVCSKSGNVDSLEENYEAHLKNFVEFQERFTQWIADSKKVPQMEKTTDEIRTESSIASSRTSVSSRSKLCSAKAKRLIAQKMKLKNLHAKLELENEQRDIEARQKSNESKQKLLDQQTELEEAIIEETVWREAVDEDEGDAQVIFPDNTQSNVRSQNLFDELNDRNAVSIETQNNNSNRTPEVGKRPSSMNVDNVFKSLAATLREGFNLPKPEILTFDGNPARYLKFVKNFETNIEAKISDNSVRLSYLIQYCEGEAKESIDDCVLLEPKSGYERARTILHSRYGRLHVISRSYIDSLVQGEQIKASDYKSLSTVRARPVSQSLSKLSLAMQKCEITLSQLVYASDIDNSDNLKKILKRLPMNMRVKWADIAYSINESDREPRFSVLAKFVEEKSRIASSMYGHDLCDKGDKKGTNSLMYERSDKAKVKVTTLSTQSENKVLSRGKYIHVNAVLVVVIV